MLGEYIAGKGKSVYRVAKESGLPYTTLNEIVLGKKDPGSITYRTLSQLASYFGVSVPELYSVITGEPGSPSVSTSWDDARRKAYKFPVVAETDAFDISRVHPLKQREALAVFEAIRDDDRISAAIIFGSAQTIRCQGKSDLDLCVALKPCCTDADTKNEVSEKIQKACGFDADILWLDRLEKGSFIYENVMRGVRIV